jgi:two-component system chemotaxis response regulator CheY
MSKPLAILIVDDNLNFVNRMIGLIKELNPVEYIQIAENYDEACRYLADDIPDVALLDINLPGKNGLAVLKKVKESAPACNVIMITNHADEYYRTQCREMGAGHFLDKTIEFSRVPHILKELSINRAAG